MQKTNIKWFHLGLAASLILASCDNKQQKTPSTPDSSQTSGDSAKQNEQLLAKRVAAFGFMAHLPKDTAMVLGVFKPEQKIRSTGLVEMSQKLMKQSEKISMEVMKASQQKMLDNQPLVQPPDVAPPDPQDLTAVNGSSQTCQQLNSPAIPAESANNNAAAMQKSAQSVLLRILPYVSDEVVVASGKSIADNYAMLYQLLEQSNKQSYGRMLDLALQNPGSEGKAEGELQELANNLYELIKNSSGFNVSIACKVEQAQIDEFKQMSGELSKNAAALWKAKQSTHQSAGFSGELVSIDLAEVAKLIMDGYKNSQQQQSSVQGLPEGLDEAKLLESLQGKQLHVWFASNADHVLVMTANTQEELQLAEKPQDSLLAHGDFDFADTLLASGSTPMMAGYISNETVQKVYDSSKKYGLASYSTLIKELVGKQSVKEKLADSSALMAQVERTEQAMQKLYENIAVSGSNFFVDCSKDGINIELDTGSKGMPFYTQPLKYADLAKNGNVIFFGNYLVGKQYQINSNNFYTEYGKSLYEVAKLYASSDKVAAAEFVGGFNEFESNYREALSGIWSNLIKMSNEGFGEEVAVLVDNQGVMPNFPMIPKDISKNNIPGIVMISEIKDRKVVASSWDGIWQQVNNIYLKATASLPPNTLMSELPSPTLLPNGEYSTAFFQLPLFDQRFTPNLCISNQHLVYANNFERSNQMQVELKSLPQSSQKLAYMRFNPQALDALLQQYKGSMKEYAGVCEMSSTLSGYIKEVEGSTAMSNKGSLKLILKVKTSGKQD